MIIGPDGKSVTKSNAENIRFSAGGLSFETQSTPDDLLNKAYSGAIKSIAEQVYNQVYLETKSAHIAQEAAQSSVNSLADPFAFEPCAQAVFMYLSREIEYRDNIINQINNKLIALGCDGIDLKHKHPVPDTSANSKSENKE